MQNEELRERAISIANPPSHFQLIIEDHSEEGKASFCWKNNEEAIVVELDSEGNLIELIIELEEVLENVLSVEEKQNIAEQFLLHHYPNALEDLVFDKSKSIDNNVRFYYYQFAYDLPLAHPGSYIDIDNSGKVVEFAYRGIKEIPEMPTQLITKEKLIERIKNNVTFNLKIENVSKESFTVEESGLRLVYSIFPLSDYDAYDLEPKSIEHFEEDENIVFSKVEPVDIQSNLSLEELIGINDEYEKIREVEMDGEIGLVWQNKNYVEEDSDLTWNSYFEGRLKEPVKARISRETGKLNSFIWLEDRDGSLSLSEEECYEIAKSFLQQVNPKYYQYLYFEDCDENTDSTRFIFNFQLHNGEGTLIDEILNISINWTTGFVEYYSGPRIDLEQIDKVSTVPKITLEEAKDIFMEQLDFDLVWEMDFDEEKESYKLVYKLCDKNTRTEIRYIDAITGAVITWK